MVNLLNLFGMLRARRGHDDAPAAAAAPALIPYAHVAPQLCMLPYDGVIDETLPSDFKRIVQFKADGIRALYINGVIVSREGIPLDCALHCQPGLARIEAAAGMGALVFDGEYVADDGFNATLAEHKAGKGTGTFFVFDFLPLDEWQKGGWDWEIERRLPLLKKIMTGANTSLFVGMLDYWIMTKHDTMAKAREIWAAGGEGVVAKRIGSTYVRDRSPDWLRIKETITVDGAVVDMIGRKDGTLKTLIVRTDDGPVACGTGWSVAEGRTLLAMHAGSLTETPIWAEIAYQRTTGTKRSIRGARFIRVRMPKGATA